jgi:DNA-binding Lrp family transcriptional regulator
MFLKNRADPAKIRKSFYSGGDMDKRDAQMLTLLQADATIGLNELAKAVNLSPTPCWRRLQKLRDEGVICRQVVLCDPNKLNLGLSTTAVDMPELRRRAFGNGTAGHGTDVGAAKLTTTLRAQWNGAVAISVDTVTGGSPER